MNTNAGKPLQIISIKRRGVRSHGARHLARIGVALAGLVSLAGCSLLDTLHDKYVVDSAVVPNKDHPTTGAKIPGPINLDCYVFVEDEGSAAATDGPCAGWKNPTSGKKTAYKVVVGLMSDPASNYGMIQRNRLIEIIKDRADEICHIHKASILSNAAAFNFATSLTSTILSGVSSAVGGAVALSAASSSVGVLGTEIRANVYQNILAPAVLKKIDELQKERWKTIDGHFVDLGNAYTIDRAIRDLNQYHHECSFFRGIMELAEGTRVEPMTRTEIDTEITALQTENAALEAKFAGKDKDLNTDFVAREAQRQWEANNVRLFELRLLRQKAPLRKSQQPKADDPQKPKDPSAGTGPGGASAVKQETLPNVQNPTAAGTNK